jgi:hypothetical protein
MVRKILVTLLAVVALAAIAQPAAAQAGCGPGWRIPDRTVISQTNRVSIDLQEKPRGRWSAYRQLPGRQFLVGQVRFTSFTDGANGVKFTILWTNGMVSEFTGSVYRTETITTGYVSGTVQDALSFPGNEWRFRDVVHCA